MFAFHGMYLLQVATAAIHIEPAEGRKNYYTKNIFIFFNSWGNLMGILLACIGLMGLVKPSDAKCIKGETRK